MKILVLFTGGTIGSTVDGATVHTDPAAASRLLSLYRARFGEDVLFEVRRPCNLLSENATPGLWSLLERSVREEFAKCTRSDAANNKNKLVGRINFVKNKLISGE